MQLAINCSDARNPLGRRAIGFSRLSLVRDHIVAVAVRAGSSVVHSRFYSATIGIVTLALPMQLACPSCLACGDRSRVAAVGVAASTSLLVLMRTTVHLRRRRWPSFQLRRNLLPRRHGWLLAVGL